MVKLVIDKVDIIRNVKRDGNVVALNRVLIHCGNKPTIFRSFDQFITDLQDSFLIDSTVDSINDPDVLDVLADLQGGTVSGNVVFHKAGDKYKIDESHPAITNPNHAQYGKLVVGQEMVAEKDGARVPDGFLTFRREMSAQAIHKSANSYAKHRLVLEGFTRSITSSTPAGQAPKDTDDFQMGDPNASTKKEIVGEE